MSVKTVVTALKSAATEVGKAFTEPDDDWIPVAYVVGKDKTSIVAMEFRNQYEKERAVEAIRMLADIEEAVYVGFVLSSWRVETTNEADAKRAIRIGASKSEKRIETLVIQVMGKDEKYYAHANIIRDGVNPPTLGKWDWWDNDSKKQSKGIFDTVQDVLREPEMVA